jgi:hypothetical protein
LAPKSRCFQYRHVLKVQPRHNGVHTCPDSTCLFFRNASSTANTEARDGSAASKSATANRVSKSGEYAGYSDAPYNNLGLPWSGFNEEDIIPLTPGQPTELVFEILPISMIFGAGHSSDTASQIGVRSRRRLMGEHILTEHDIFSGTVFPDTIAVCPDFRHTYRRSIPTGMCLIAL